MTGLNRGILKYIAVITMTLDHIAAYLFSSDLILYTIFRSIGRITAPVICLFVAEGYFYTQSKLKYFLRILVFAMISQIPFMLAEGIGIKDFRMNILFTLMISFGVIWCYDFVKNSFFKWVSIILLIGISYFSDWAFIVPIWVLIFYALRNNKNLKFRNFTVTMMIYLVIICLSSYLLKYQLLDYLFHFGMLLSIPILWIYNGINGKKHHYKWLFYGFYPLHLIIIVMIRTLLE